MLRAHATPMRVSARRTLSLDQLHAPGCPATLADVVARAPAVEDVPELLLPPPAWLHWNHSEAALWPRPEPQAVDLNQLTSPSWLLEAGQRARHRLSQMQ